MLEYDRINTSEGIDLNKTGASKKCDICHFWYFKDIAFKYEKYLCSVLMILCKKLWALIMLLLFMLKGVLTELIFGIWVKIMQLT